MWASGDSWHHTAISDVFPSELPVPICHGNHAHTEAVWYVTEQSKCLILQAEGRASQYYWDALLGCIPPNLFLFFNRT